MPKVQLIAVGPHVTCVMRPRYLSNSYIVHDDEGVVLIDAGMEADGSDMLYALKQIGRRVEDVSAILLTHWHNDHSAGAEALRLMSNARVYYGAGEHRNFTRTAVRGLRMKLADQLPESGVFAAVKAILGQSPPRAITGGRIAVDGDVLEHRFEVIGTAGHSAGHLSYFYTPDRVLFAGDAVAVCRKRLWFMSRFLTEDLSLAREAMNRCIGVEAEVVCPGHKEPLASQLTEHRRALREYLHSGKSWPLVS